MLWKDYKKLSERENPKLKDKPMKRKPQTTEYKTCRLTKNQNEDWTDLKIETDVEETVVGILDRKEIINDNSKKR